MRITAVKMGIFDSDFGCGLITNHTVMTIIEREISKLCFFRPTIAIFAFTQRFLGSN